MTPPFQSAAVSEKNSDPLASYCFDMICRQSSIISRTLKKYGHMSVGKFLKFAGNPQRNGYQTVDSFFEVIYEYVSTLLGETTAHHTIKDLKRSRMVMTANHHGVDYFAQSVQGSLIFSFLQSALNSKCRTIPILACGNIPLNNLTYPRGLMIYKMNPSSLNDMPLKVPVYSDRLKRTVVSAVEPFDREMIKRVQSKIMRSVSKNVISDRLASTINMVLEEDYGDSSVLNSENYSQQAVLVNYRLWNRLFTDSTPAPELIYLELEKIVASLLEKDFTDEKSLAWAVMFDPALRSLILDELDGQRVCWNNAKLSARLQIEILTGNKRKKIGNCGTHFFWGIDDSLRQVPLYLEKTGPSSACLKGRDDKGEIWQIQFTPEAVLSGLKKGKLLPSLFTSYLSVSLARGITCIGGYYQGVYLPLIQKGVVKALEQVNSYDHAAECVAGVDTRCYISGMQTVMVPCEEGSLVPAGPLEIINAGGLCSEDLERIKTLLIADAHLASLFDTIPDIAPREEKPSDWKTNLARECHHLLNEKIVVKD